MVPHFYYLSAIALLLGTFACQRKALPVKEKKEEVESLQSALAELDQIARETYREGYEIVYNQPRTAALVRKTVWPGQRAIFPTIYFFVYDMTAQSVIFDDVVIQAEDVKWVRDGEIAVISAAGQIEDLNGRDGRSGYIFNLKTRTKRAFDQK